MLQTATLLSLATVASIAITAHAVQWAGEQVPYRLGDAVPVTCLNRSIETGEHISDAQGHLQYIPFPTCAETKHPLAFSYLQSRPQNCTITLTDELFHLLEFYIHNDAPLSCRLPAMHASHQHTMSPGGSSSSGPTADKIGSTSGSGGSGAVQHISEDADGDIGAEWVPMVIGLAGQLQRSHVHVANSLNVIIHTGPPVASSSEAVAQKTFKAKKKQSKPLGLVGAVDSASAYSVSPHTRNTRIVIGDELTFAFSVHWYDGQTLTSSTSSSGGSWFFPVLFGIIIGFGACYVALKGIVVPKSIERFVVGKNDVLPKYNGYGYGIGTGGTNGFSGPRKGD